MNESFKLFFKNVFNNNFIFWNISVLMGNKM